METLVVILSILVAVAALAAATLIAIRAIQTADRSGERLERFFSEHADRLQGIHVAGALGANVPPKKRQTALEIAAESGLDMNNPEHVTIFNKIQEELAAEQGIEI